MLRARKLLGATRPADETIPAARRHPAALPRIRRGNAGFSLSEWRRNRGTLNPGGQVCDERRPRSPAARWRRLPPRRLAAPSTNLVCSRSVATAPYVVGWPDGSERRRAAARSGSVRGAFGIRAEADAGGKLGSGGVRRCLERAGAETGEGRNVSLGPRTVADIDAQVAKVLKGLGDLSRLSTCAWVREADLPNVR